MRHGLADLDATIGVPLADRAPRPTGCNSLAVGGDGQHVRLARDHVARWPAGSEIENDCLPPSGRDDPVTCRSKLHEPDPAIHHERLVLRAASGQVPEPNVRFVVEVIGCAHGEPAAVRAKCQRPGDLGVSERLAERLSRGRIPKPNQAVVVCRRNRSAVRAECDARYIVGVPQRPQHSGPGGGIPDVDRSFVDAGPVLARGDQAAVRAEREVLDVVAVVRERNAHRLARPGAPVV